MYQYNVNGKHVTWGRERDRWGNSSRSVYSDEVMSMGSLPEHMQRVGWGDRSRGEEGCGQSREGDWGVGKWWWIGQQQLVLRMYQFIPMA